MRTFVAVVVLLLVCHATEAQPARRAQPSSESKFAERFRRADKNGDGQIDAAEARVAGLWFADDFNSVDTDHSGTVTLFELGQALQQRVKGWMSDFDAADTNHDGRLSEAEAKQAPRVAKAFKVGPTSPGQGMSRPEYESYALDRLYRNSELPAVAPNIIEKKF